MMIDEGLGLRLSKFDGPANMWISMIVNLLFGAKNSKEKPKLQQTQMVTSG